MFNLSEALSYLNEVISDLFFILQVLTGSRAGPSPSKSSTRRVSPPNRRHSWGTKSPSCRCWYKFHIFIVRLLSVTSNVCVCVCVCFSESVPPRCGPGGGDVWDGEARLCRHGEAPWRHAGDDSVQWERPTPWTQHPLPGHAGKIAFPPFSAPEFFKLT